MTLDNAPTQEAAPTLWHGLFPGIVVDTADPLKRGHVKVRVPQVHGDISESEFISDTALPWAKPIMPPHTYHADFEVGDGIWVSFWGGSSSDPIWHGQFLGDGDAPKEFTSSYAARPATRIVRTTNGHVIEMRWVEGEEQIRVHTAGGNVFDLLDATAKGPKIELATPGKAGLKLVDNVSQGGPLAELKLPGGTLLRLVEAAPGPSAQITTPGGQVISAVDSPIPSIDMTSQGTFNIIALLALIISSSLTVAITATGILSLTGSIVAIASTAGVISLGNTTEKKKIVLENFITDVYNGHGHGGMGAGPPTILGVPGDHSSVNVEVD